jgi:hypothetical protein
MYWSWWRYWDWRQCSLLKSSTPIKCCFGRVLFCFVGHFTKMCFTKFPPFTMKVYRKIVCHKIQWRQFANKNIIGLQSWHSDRHCHTGLSDSNNSCNFDFATLTWHWLQLRLGKHNYMWMWIIPNKIGWRVVTKFEWNLEHWMHWCECHYTVFIWKLWIGLEFWTLGNQPKTGELCFGVGWWSSALCRESK